MGAVCVGVTVEAGPVVPVTTGRSEVDGSVGETRAQPERVSPASRIKVGRQSEYLVI
jgi:hypothetical protein